MIDIVSIEILIGGLLMAGAGIIIACRASRKCKTLSALLADSLDTLPHGFLLFGGDDRLARKNLAAEHYLPALGNTDEPETLDSFLDYIFAHKCEGQPRRHAHKQVPHDFCAVAEINALILLVQGNQLPSGETLVLLTDISDLQRQQEQFLRADRQNYELRQATEATANGIFIFDPKKPSCPVTFVNGAYCVMTGIAREEIAGKSFFALLEVQKNPPGRNELTAAIAERRPVRLEWDAHEEDRTVSYQLVLSPVFDGDGKLDLFIGIQIDVSEIKLQEAQFFQAQKLEALGQLAGGVAHDFNNVLSIIDGYVRMALKHAPPDDAQLAGDLDKIKQASKRGAALTKQLLMFGRHKIAGESIVDLWQLLHEHERLLQPLLDSSITLKIRAQKNLFIECPSDGMAQIIMNLVINARDAMPEGGEIIIEAERLRTELLRTMVPGAPGDRDFVMLTITDTGIGMDSKTMARIFDPFFTTKEQGRGTGLGLSMVYGIVREVKGFIDVQATPGEGTVMRVFLPLSDKRAGKEISETTDNTAGIRFDGYTALVAEDESDLLELMATMLEELGMEVLRASNGAEALVLQDDYEGDIDLLLTDVVMPELNGVKLAELFQAVREETKVIFMSGFPASGKLSRITIPEGAILLAKPVEFEKLALVMKALLDEDELDPHVAELSIWQAANA